MSDAPSPERGDRRRAELRKLARRALNKAGVQVGGEHLIGHIADAMAAECERLRDRSASIVEVLCGRGEAIQPEALELLAYTLRHHYVDEDGEIQIAFPDTPEGAL